MKMSSSIPLSAETIGRLHLVFRRENRPEAERLLVEECGASLPGLYRASDCTPESLERLRFAAMKLSGGQLDKLQQAIELANKDWRDLLMAAGFGEDCNAHHRWLPREDF
jgi:hypothetical protein